MDSKPCAVCGRAFRWRKKWERDWDAVTHCSDACRRRGLRDVDRAAESLLQALVAGAGRTGVSVETAIPPGGALEDARRAARRLAWAGAVELVQGGRRVDPSEVRGSFVVRRR